MIIEDDPLQAHYLEHLLNADGWQSAIAGSGAAAQTLLQQQQFEVILLDIYLPDINGIDLLKQLRSQDQGMNSNCVIIAMTGLSTTELAVEAMRHGAYDFLEKPITRERLWITLENALRHHQLTTTLHDYQKNFERDHFHNMIGASLPMQNLFRIIESAAPSKATVFITGESGTGKELCAEALHQQSQRSNGPFVAINCAAIPKELMESEIFGHVKGAFTGATHDRDGAASRANGGTLFLDEICEMDLELQTKLLRFFQTQRFQRVGGQQEESVDIRFICATNKDPSEQVQRRLFREDLFYRLHVIPIEMPPLRVRGDDILLIAREFLKRFNLEEGKAFEGFSDEVECIFLGYEWPGNVRELQNTLHNIVVLYNGVTVTRSMLPTTLRAVPPQCPLPLHEGKEKSSRHSAQENTIAPLWQVEMETIERAIQLCDGNVNRAAELLDINPSTIYRKRKRWEPEGQES
jgi:two-component system repressor protein LuxO